MKGDSFTNWTFALTDCSRLDMSNLSAKYHLALLPKIKQANQENKIDLLLDLAECHLLNLFLMARGTFVEDRTDLLIREARSSAVCVMDHDEVLEVEKGVHGNDVAESVTSMAAGVAGD